MTSSEQGQHSSAEVRVRAALDRLDGLDERPLSDHGPAYERLHDDLQSVLAEIDGA